MGYDATFAACYFPNLSQEGSMNNSECFLLNSLYILIINQLTLLHLQRVQSKHLIVTNYNADRLIMADEMLNSSQTILLLGV